MKMFHHSHAVQHCVSKKIPTFKLSVTLSNLNRFTKFLHCWKVHEICYKKLTQFPSTPWLCCYTNLGSQKSKFVKCLWTMFTVKNYKRY